MSEDTKDFLKLLAIAMASVAVLAIYFTVNGHVRATDHAKCIQAASEEGIDGPSIVLLCGKV